MPRSYSAETFNKVKALKNSGKTATEVARTHFNLNGKPLSRTIVFNIWNDKAFLDNEEKMQYYQNELDKIKFPTKADANLNEKFHPAYLASFIDGDGSIGIFQINGGYQVSVSITQCVPSILREIQETYGGRITIDAERKEPSKRRKSYTLDIRGTNAYSILMNIHPFLIIKKDRAKLCLQMIHISNMKNLNGLKEKIFNSMRETYDNPQLNRPYTENMSIEYIAGLFDAEGCIASSCNGLTIAQKQDPVLLQHIVEFLGYGAVDKRKECYICNTADSLDLIKKIMPFLIVKKQQAEDRLSYSDVSSSKLQKVILKSRIKSDKHVNHTQDVDELIERNRELSQKGKLVVHREIIVNSDGSRTFSDELKKKMSEAKKGDKNPNKNGFKGTEHAKNIRQSKIKNSKRKFTDEEILEIRAERDSGSKQKDVAEYFTQKFGKDINRRLVGQIWAEKYRTVAEELADPKTQEEKRAEASKKKRGQPVEVIQKIKKLSFEDALKPAEIRDKLKVEDNLELTLDTIKGIIKKAKVNVKE